MQITIKGIAYKTFSLLITFKLKYYPYILMGFYFRILLFFIVLIIPITCLTKENIITSSKI